MGQDDKMKRISRLLAELESTDPTEDALDPNDVARLAAGRPSESVRSVLEGRLGGADAEVVAGVAAAAAERRRDAPSRWIWMSSAAAVLLMALGGWLLSAGRASTRLTDADLVTAFSALRRADPDAFAGVEPLLAAEREHAAPVVRRGGLRVCDPRGTVLDPRPTLGWDAVAGAGEYSVEILSDEGEAVLEASAPVASLSWPSESPSLAAGGSYVLRVSTVVAGVRVEGSRAFHVADATARARYRRALEVIDAEVPEDLRAVVRAQVALRLGLIAEAERHLPGEAPEAASGLADATRSLLERLRERR